MAITLEQAWMAVDSLLDYAKSCELLDEKDRIFARNQLLGELALEHYAP